MVYLLFTTIHLNATTLPCHLCPSLHHIYAPHNVALIFQPTCTPTSYTDTILACRPQPSSARQQRSGTTQSSQSAIDKDTETKLAQISAKYGQRRGEVVKKLLDRAVQIEPSLHPNYKKQ
jgi:hypothetical protein